MKHFKDAGGAVWGFELDGSQDHLIQPGMVPMSTAELDAHRNPPPTDEQLREIWKSARATAVAAITVTTAAGNTFDGDEESQGRMARAILGLQSAPGSTVTWVLADNSTYKVAAPELTEALALAGVEQARLWVAE